jgi:phosphoglucomutase
MQNLRDNTPTSIGGVKVKSAGDYKSGEVRDLESGEISTTGQPSSDVLYYTLVNEDKIIVRPSGTEPKIKVYYSVRGENEADASKVLESRRAIINKIIEG